MLSEKPQTYHFPARNRIIAGLSKGVLIIEAPMRSGALITKEYALEFNRELFVVPGRINDIYSKGSNEVIRSCQGSMVLTAQDVLQAYNKCLDGVGESKRVQLSIEEELIYKTLEMGEKHYETLLIETGLGASQLNILLTKLELMGVVAKLPGNIYTITMN